MSSGKFLNHYNARTPEQRELMAQIESDGVCPFCKEYFTKYHPKPILHETNNWFVTENMSPYEGTRAHILFVYKLSHITRPEELSDAAKLDLFSLVELVSKELEIVGGSLFMRFGDVHYNGSSVEHLHAQLLTGGPESDDVERIRVKLGYYM